MKAHITSSQAILEQAVLIAKTEGIHQLNVRRLAKECGIAIGSVYNYYPNKLALMEEVAGCFWKEILKNQELVYRDKMGFTSFILQYYSFIYGRLKNYDREWVDGVIGKPFEKEASRFLQKALEEDEKVDPSIWNMELTKEAFAQHVLMNLTALLRKGESNCKFFVFLLEQLLYRN